MNHITLLFVKWIAIFYDAGGHLHNIQLF